MTFLGRIKLLLSVWFAGSKKATAQQADAVVSKGPESSIPEGLRGALVSGDKGRVVLDPSERRDYAVIRRVDKILLVVSPTVCNTSGVIAIRRRVGNAFPGEPIDVIEQPVDVIAQIYADSDAVKQPLRTKSKRTVAEMTRPERLIEEMVSEAHKLKTSDIHIESFVNSGRIMFRVNGKREVWRDLPHEDLLSMGQVMYGFYAEAASKEPTWDHTQVNDCSLEWETAGGIAYQLRFSSSPVHPSPGFHIVLRMLPMTVGSGILLTQVGYSTSQLEKIVAATTSRKGLVLLCGATNSGKSTSIQAILRNVFEARGHNIKLITVEDPVEYVIPGACQIPVARKRRGDDESFFEKALRGTLRQDPDFVMVGEIRDSTSARTTQDLGLAGRKLMATLHTNSALGAYTRLDKIGLPLDITCSPDFMSAIVYQSLVPTLCQHCAIPWTAYPVEKLEPAFVRRVQSVADVTKLKMQGPGCNHCRHTGYIGRTVCAEVVVPDRDLSRLVFENKGNTIHAETYWLENGGKRIIEHGIEKMLMGIVSPIDVEANIENF